MFNDVRWIAKDPLEGLTLHASFTADQRAFRFRNDDGGEATATWKATQNTNISQPVGQIFRLRIAIQETAGGSANNQTIVLQSNVNGEGWFDVGPDTARVRLGASPNVANNTPTTRQLTGTSGNFLPGVLLTTTSGTNISFAGGDHTEVEWASILIDGSVPIGANVQFRTTINGAVPATVTSGIPTVTAAAPPPPTAAPVLSITNITNTTMTLSWTSVPNATEYVIEYYGTEWTQTDVTTGTTRDVATNVPGATYRFRVYARNSGGSGPYSNEVEGTAPVELTAPTLSGTSTVDSITLSWTSVTGAESYIVRDVDTQQDIATVTGTTHTLTQLPASTARTFTVSAQAGGTAGPASNSLTISTLASAPTAPPTGAPVLTSVLNGNNIDSSWTAVEGATRYQVANGDWVWSVTDLSFTFFADQNNTFNMRVRAGNDVGWGPYSNSVYITTDPLPSVTGLVDGFDGAISADWTTAETHDVVDGYLRLGTSVSISNKISTGTVWGLNLGESIYVDASEIVAPIESGVVTEFIIRTPFSNTKSWVFRQHRYSAGHHLSLQNNGAVLTTLDYNPVEHRLWRFTKDVENLIWETSRDGETWVERGRVYVGSNLTIGVTLQAWSSGIDEGLVPAFKGVNVLYSEAPTTTPVLSLAGATETSLIIAWDKILNSQSYDVERNGVIVGTTENLSFTSTNLSAGTSYDFRVRAVNPMGVGPWSNILTVSTKTGTIEEPTTPPQTETVKLYLRKVI